MLLTTGETETERKDVTEENNSMHFQDDPETSAISLDYHPNIPMGNNLNMPVNGRTDDAESVADNTMMRELYLGFVYSDTLLCLENVYGGEKGKIISNLMPLLNS